VTSLHRGLIPDGLPFVKGHGTGNDFVIVPDPDGRLALSAVQVAALCDRRRGIGGDGLLRVVRTAHLADLPREVPVSPGAAATPGPDGAGRAAEADRDEAHSVPATPAQPPVRHSVPATPAQPPVRHSVPATPAQPPVRHSVPATPAQPPEWFMDYRNADGSLAEMCGNGARVFARYLVETGLAGGPQVSFLTRAGVVTATVGPSEVSVTMPPVVVGGPGVVRVAGMEIKGTTVTCGNPNLVCVVSSLDDLDLREPPGLDPDQFPAGANVEFVVPVEAGYVRMRVVERGVGETLSCGSGACAVAGVVLNGVSGTVTIDVPGGRLTVTIGDDRSCVLTGPAVLVGAGTVALAS